MKITDETKTFTGEDGTLEVSSNFSGTHEFPSMYLYADDGAGNSQGYGTDNIDQIKEIIQHMAKMAGLDVEFPEWFRPRYQPGDRVRSTHEDSAGRLGTVRADRSHQLGWNVTVVMDGEAEYGLFMYDELEPVTGE